MHPARDSKLFLRVTFYRWVEQWAKMCPRLAWQKEHVVLAVGDLHVENFGAWRDSRERLAWGVNDFDEACEVALHERPRAARHQRDAGGRGGWRSRRRCCD